MTRLGMLPEQQFAEDFKQLRRNIEEIKNAQRIGRDIMKPKVIEVLDGSGNPTLYDLVSVYDGFGSTRAEFTMIFTADHQLEPWVTPFVQLFYGSLTNPGTDVNVYGFQYLSLGKTEPGKIAYNGSFGTNLSPDSTLVYAKFYANATDTGVLEVLPEYIE